MNKCVEQFAEGNPEEWEKMIRNNSRICFVILFLHLVSETLVFKSKYLQNRILHFN